MKLLSKFAPKTFIIKVVHFLRLLERLYGKGKTENKYQRGYMLTAHQQCDRIYCRQIRNVSFIDNQQYISSPHCLL